MKILGLSQRNLYGSRRAVDSNGQRWPRLGERRAAAVDTYVFATMAAPAAGAPTAPTPPTTPAPPTAAAAAAAAVAAAAAAVAAASAAAAAAAVDLLHDSDQNVLACLGKLMSVRTPSGQSIQ